MKKSTHQDRETVGATAKHSLIAFLALLVATSILPSCSDDDNDDDIYEIVDPIDIGYSAPNDTVTLMTWNVGHWAYGKNMSSAITDERYDAFYDSLLTCIKTVGPHIVGLQELSDLIIDTEEHDNVRALNLLKRMGFKYQYVGDGGQQRHWICNALTSMLPLGQSATNEYDYNYSYWNTNARSYYYVTSSVVLGKTEVPIIVTHLAFSITGDTCVSGQIEELVEKSKEYDRLIIMGDMNLRNLETIAPFEEAGMTVCNYGDNKVKTWPSDSPTHYDDHIILKA